MIELPGEIFGAPPMAPLFEPGAFGVYRPKPVAGADDLVLMRRIDELHLEKPVSMARGE